MKELERKFTGKGEVGGGFEFEQIDSNGFAYIYKVTSDNSVYYEIFEHRENTMFDCVSYPKLNAFGIWAKTTSDLAKAKEYYTTFTNNVRLRIEERERRNNV